MFDPFGDGKESQSTTSSSVQWPQPCHHFEFPEILLATNNFDESLVIGSGGFGKVYKGNVIIGSSLVVAAFKRLDAMSTQGEEEFWAEVQMLSKLRHCHLVSLFGYCSYKEEKILVYEYMPNGTLEKHIHKLQTPLSWVQRLKICIGAARGLDYLHTGTGIESGVIHRDVKSSNILLHESWAAKISDFGLSRIGPTNQPCTYVNTLVKGTFGYFDPNYFTTGKLTRKSDVYAFGVVLLEVLCRKRAVDRSLDEEQWGLVTWAQDSIKEGNLKNIIDYDIRGQISTKCLKEFVQIVERSLLNNPKHRPTMAEVVVSLDSILALQEKINSSLQGAGKTIFGRMLDRFASPSNRENSAHGDSKISSNSKSKSRNASDTIEANNSMIHVQSLKLFTFADLKRATRNFNLDSLLGNGGFGDMFLCWVDKNTFAPSTKGLGIAVVVKRYNKARRSSHNVITVLGSLAHPNIISLLGYCDDKKDGCLLVYEYMENQHLGHFLYGGSSKPLSWGTRLNIMIGVARALAFMHSSKDQVIHRDVKPSNILLDQDFNAKLGDFELARVSHESEATDITTSVAGSFGYVDPEYAMTCRLSAGSDVYSFGVVLLETLTGKDAFNNNIKGYGDQVSLVEWARLLLVDRSELKKIMDPSLQQNYPLDGAFELATLALRCVLDNRKDRPSSEELLLSLEQIYDDNEQLIKDTM
ncbi:probable serine/threonine-protein kinase PBL18 [Lactuca sativa]|uniref:probable serine/threonine-protein kinase PBL18 n=1 Tax=Lactuca sativa TaxID=4236 RepID=UPI000CD9E280|nr:probable serine/threonine-protein kinase PBL18 [Lactuca sativa]